MKRGDANMGERALAAYEKGSISIGKLAKIIGLDQVSAYHYIREHGIRVSCQDFEEIKDDSENA